VPLSEACATKGLDIDNVIASLEAATAPLAAGEKDWAKESLANLATYIVEPAPKDADEDVASWIALEPVFTQCRGKGRRSGAEALFFVMLMTAIAVA
jgi:iron-sulfur cluster repair protein YtfE (RIC family)